VAVFLRYLADLTPEHQRIWQAKIAAGDYWPHPDYYRSSILGDWHERISIIDAFFQGLHHINHLCGRIGRSPLFRHDMHETDRPRKLSFLIRPTLREFQAFVHALDKLMSDNINRDFFGTDVPLETEETRKDGKIVVTQKGTIQILDDWLRAKFKTPDRTSVDAALAAFREVRRLRQRPAHTVDQDRFDQAYFQQQRELMIRVYEAVNILRRILASHPRAAGYEVSENLREGKIWTF
jgi:hypothetical protein